MSLCGDLRSDAVSQRQNDLTSCIRSQSDGLRALLAVHTTIANNHALSSLFDTSFAGKSLGDHEIAFLKENALSSGRTCNPDVLTISLPQLNTTDNTSPYVSKSTNESRRAPSQLTSSENETARPTTATEASGQILSPVSINGYPAEQSRHGSPKVATTIDQPPARVDSPDGPSAPPGLIAPPMPEEVPDLSNETQQLLDRESPQRPARTVHLPPEEVQEEKLRQRQLAEERRRELSIDSTRLHRPSIQSEFASSPSSTVDATSTITPTAPHTPDTSPDSEHAEEILPPKELRLSPEKQRQKDEHDRILAAQKEIAHAQALGDIATPDEQLRFEEREAAARSAEESAARDRHQGPEPTVRNDVEMTEAAQLVQAVNDEAQSTVARTPKPDKNIATEKLPKLVEATPIQANQPQDAATPTIDPSRLAPPDARRPSRTPSAGGPSAGPSGHAGLQRARPSFIATGGLNNLNRSPSAATSSAETSLGPSLNPGRRVNERSQKQKQLELESALEQLHVLKGAAEDPDRDYLEPLFRIQAHEPPNSRTRTLAELVKLVPKALSTQDHFVSNHERLDFRMLRRIYHLQNANKWSLRQMERGKEPEQPVTHHDHLMAEMKWMRKDFKAERKIKKSICAWLAQRCAEWVHASPERRTQLQVKPAAIEHIDEIDDAAAEEDDTPDLEPSGESSPEDETPGTPPAHKPTFTATLIVPPELCEAVQELEKANSLTRALESLPAVGLLDHALVRKKQPLTNVSKFVQGKILPLSSGPTRKRSRYDYEDEAEVVDSSPSSKRLRDSKVLPPEDLDCALFLPDNKPVLDRLRSASAFRPPSEFPMPLVSFYEYRNGSQWIVEDDTKLRKLAKDYSFNWSLIADEMALPTRFKGSAERRTPWECFERWVELESLPADMRKTMYFKTWYQRLETSQQAADRRYQIQLAAMEQRQAQSGGPPHNMPAVRKKTTPTRVEKRKATRYLWLVDGFRRLAKKREQHAWKQAEAARAAAQRKTQPDNNAQNQVKMTPAEFSRKRYMNDLQQMELQKQMAQKHMEARQRQMAMQRMAQQQQMQSQLSQQQRSAGIPGQAATHPQTAGQQTPGMNAQMQQLQQQQQAAAGRPMTAHNTHLSAPQMSGHAAQQLQQQRQAVMGQRGNMQQLAQANAQRAAAQYASQHFQMTNGNVPSPGTGGMTNQQQMQANQAMLAAYAQQQQQQAQQHAQQAQQQQQHHHQQQQTPQQQQQSNNVQANMPQQMSSPSMPPPPTPQSGPQQLSSGHVPQIIAIKNQLRLSNPNMSEENLVQLATQHMRNASQTTAQARQNAMNAAAGLNQSQHAGAQAYAQNAANAYQPMAQMTNNGVTNNACTGNNSTTDASNQQQQSAAQQHPAMAAHGFVTTSSPQQTYANLMRQRSLQQMNQLRGSPAASAAALANSGSPNMTHASPNMTPASPNVQYSNMATGTNQGMMTPQQQQQAQQQARPPSRSATPQMQRLGSSGSIVVAAQSPNGVPAVPAVAGTGGANAVGQPGLNQGSPMARQASMAR